ncbi:hypothetical protein B0H10DRAFT_1951143 [Mycena sp. CBHHK59/15]|nr:hypothetical protein B0H10DRAFT_1951143 [Mycena sp. CBHHK59/15]
MVVPLAQITREYSHCIPVPGPPSNPPTAADCAATVKFKGAIFIRNAPLADTTVEGVTLYESEIIVAHQITLQAPPGPGPGPAAACRTTSCSMHLSLWRVDWTLGWMVWRVDWMNGNIRKGTGLDFPYDEVLFQDALFVLSPASLPTGCAALPALLDVDDIQGLTEAEAMQYLHGFSVPLPHPVVVLQHKCHIAHCVGCTIQICLQLLRLSRHTCSGSSSSTRELTL